MDPRDLLPPPEHPYFVSSRAKGAGIKRSKTLKAKLLEKMQIFSIASERTINIEKFIRRIFHIV